MNRTIHSFSINMRVSILSTVALLSACSAATPLRSLLPRSSGMFNLDWTRANAIKTVNEIMQQLPVDIKFWGMNQTEGFMGVNIAVEMNDLLAMGLVSMKSNVNAKVNVNVTITGLDQ